MLHNIKRFEDATKAVKKAADIGHKLEFMQAIEYLLPTAILLDDLRQCLPGLSEEKLEEKFMAIYGTTSDPYAKEIVALSIYINIFEKELDLRNTQIGETNIAKNTLRQIDEKKQELLKVLCFATKEQIESALADVLCD